MNDAETTSLRFTGSFTQQEPLPEASIAAAHAVLQGSRLHRYNLLPGEKGEVAFLEEEFADWQGRSYCLAVTSGGQALQIALRAAGVSRDDVVLTNAFTLAPVPGAIEAAGGRVQLVEVTEDLTIDLSDLSEKADMTGARFLLLSHMRGYLADMDQIMKIAREREICVIEDCAHSMGASWDRIRSGNHGHVACFSAQTYKHINSGEGGLIVSDDQELMARATILSGSYMNYRSHGARPGDEVFEDIQYSTPNLSARLDTLRAAILRPQIPLIDERVSRWNHLHDLLRNELSGAKGVALPMQKSAGRRVGSSFQFRLPAFDASDCADLVVRTKNAGLELKWFGAPQPHGFTSTHASWRYFERQNLPRTDRILSTLFDLRLPLTFSAKDVILIGGIIRECIEDD